MSNKLFCEILHGQCHYQSVSRADISRYPGHCADCLQARDWSKQQALDTNRRDSLTFQTNIWGTEITFYDNRDNALVGIIRQGQIMLPSLRHAFVR